MPTEEEWDEARALEILNDDFKDAQINKLKELEKAVLEYLSEIDNPVPDAGYRRVLRNRLRTMVGAPAEPPPRRS